MVDELPSLGETEIAVLRLVWEHQPCTEREVTDLIQENRSVARTTVLKTLQRLENKGLLKRIPGKTPVRFRAAIDEKRVMPELVERFVQKVLGGSPDPLVAYLAGSQKLSAKDLETLKTIARKISGKADENKQK